MILLNGDMVITIPKEEKEQQLQHLDSLIPADQAQYAEITVLFDLVNEVVTNSNQLKLTGIVNQSEMNCQHHCQPKVSVISAHLKLVKG